MAAKFYFIACVAALLNAAYSQRLACDALIGPGLAGPFGGWGYEALGYDGLGYGAACAGGLGLAGMVPATGLAASYGGGLAVTSASPIAPTGLTVTSENAIEGTLAIAGQLPFLGAVATDGTFPTAGAGAVSYGCGDGAIGIVAEAPIVPAPTVAPAYGYGPGVGPYGYGPALGFGGCGCGLY